ncbi:MAG TPA: hypothetical protein VLE45_14640 [Burkholderiaceae bacterium]|nr:hypothetical protein [Burkholderiaceae bacterium]
MADMKHQRARVRGRLAAAAGSEGDRQGARASINDMVLWLCSTALREYLAEGRERRWAPSAI